MKLQKLLFMISTLILSCCNNVDQMTSIKVKPLSNQEMVMVRKNNNIIKYQKHELKRNNNGSQDSLLVLEEKYNDQGNLISEYTRYYNDNNLITEENLIEYFDNGKKKHELKVRNNGYMDMKPIITFEGRQRVIFSEKEETFYDNLGREVSYVNNLDDLTYRSVLEWKSDTSYVSESFDPSGSLTKMSYNIVDNKGNVIKEFNSLYNNNLESGGYYKFDQDGNETIHDAFYNNAEEYVGQPRKKQSDVRYHRYRNENKYVKNKLTEKLSYESNGSLEEIKVLELTGKEIHEYDEYNNEIKSTHIYSDTSIYTTSYKYDNFGNILEELELKNGVKYTLKINTYDNNGYLIQDKTEDLVDSEIETIQYEYNNIGLITKETMTKVDKKSIYIYSYYTPNVKSINYR